MRASLVLSSLLCSVGLAMPAQGAVVAYVSTFDGELGNPVSYNSTGGTNTISNPNPGEFIVTLGGAGNGLNSNVQVNAVFDQGVPDYCTNDGWGPDGAGNVDVYVYCFGTGGGALEDYSDFTVLYQSRTTKPSTGEMAFLWANRPSIAIGHSYHPDSFYSFNSTGKINSVTHNATGNYFVLLPGMSVGGNPQVTPYTGSAARCEVADWYHNSAGTWVSVYCVNGSNVATDMEFSLSYTEGSLQSDGSTATGAYAWARNAASLSYTPSAAQQYNALGTGSLTATRYTPGKGAYSLNIPNPSNTVYNTYIGMTTATGTSGEYCVPEEIEIPTGTIDMAVQCFSAAGMPLNARYTGTILFSH